MQAQTTSPNWKQLESRFAGEDGPETYQALAGRLGKEAISIGDLAALYYGSRFLPGDSGRNNFRAADLARMTNRADAPRLLAQCDSVLTLRPADLTANFYKGLALFLVDTASSTAVEYRNRYEAFCDVILSSGTGANCEQAIHVMAEADAEEIMRFLSIRKMVRDEDTKACARYRITSSPIYGARVIHFRIWE